MQHLIRSLPLLGLSIVQHKMAEGYTVHDVGDEPPTSSSSAVLIDSVRYPPNDTPGVSVVTELGLWKVESNLGSVFSLSFWRSFFNKAPDYNIILQQKSQIKLGDSVRNFVLHETGDLEESKAAFPKIRETIEPLVDDCTVLLTESLLEEIILPKPVEVSRLAHHLTEVMDSNPEAHPDWVSILRSLTLSAIGHDNSEDVQKLLDKGVAVDSTDGAGNTMIHKAAGNGSVKILKSVTAKLSNEEKQKVLAKTNQEGKAPLHVAFEKNNPDAVTELVKSGANLSAASENEDGSNPLHLAAEAGSNAAISAVHHKKANLATSQNPDNPERIQFLDALNATNKNGFTPLMIAVRKNYIESVISLLQAGANPNIQHTKSGDTALHYAAKEGNALLAKAIIAFRADISIENKAGNTALQEAQSLSAKDAEECKKVLQETTDHVEKAKAVLAETVEPAPLDPNSVILLGLDGGGSRGVISCQIMIALHSRMRQLQPNCAPLHKYFDYIAGTSAGGIFTAYMVYNDASVETTLTTVFKATDEILPHAPGIPAETANLSAQETVGNTGLFTDIQKPRVIIATCRADENPPVLELIRNYAQPPEKVWKTWEVVRATSAAPVYFPPYKNYVDGGLVANNPTLDAMVEIVNQTKKETGNLPKFGMVLSIGTGMSPPSKVEDLKVFVPKLSNFFRSLVELPESISALHSVINLALSQSTQSNGQEVQRARAWCDSMGVPYYRLSPQLEKAVDLSEEDKGELATLMYLAYLYALENITELDKVARLLLSRPVEK